MRKIPLCFTICALTANNTLASAQDLQSRFGLLTATGKVVGPSAEPQAGVPVMVHGPSGTTYAVTDAKGKWSLYNLPAGKYEVKPVHGAKPDTENLVTFTVKDKGLFTGWLTSDERAYQAPDITLLKEANK